jgi:hypothetical protein
VLHSSRFVVAGASLALIVGLVGWADAPAKPHLLSASSGASESAMAGNSSVPNEAILQAALSDGKVTIDEYHAAMEHYFSCVRKSGYTVEGIEERKKSGVLQVIYRIQGDYTLSADALQTCYSDTAEAVDAYWQTSSPGALAFQAHREKALNAPLMACLRKHNLATSTVKTFEQGVVAAQQAAVTGGGCLDEIGFNTWQDSAD